MYFLYEIKKVYKCKPIIIVIVLFLLLNVVMVLQEIHEITSDNLFEAREKIASHFVGPLSKENVDAISEKYNDLKQEVTTGSFSTDYDKTRYTGYAYGDYNLFRELGEELDRIYYFPEKNSELKARLNNNMAVYKLVDNPKVYLQQERLLASAGDREINALYDYTGVLKYLKYDSSSLLLVLLIVMVTGLVFTESQEMRSFQQTTVSGRCKISVAKWAFVVIIPGGISLLMYLMDYFIFKVSLGLKGLSVPLYYMEEYSFTSLDWSINKYVVLAMLLKLLAMIAFSLICAGIATITPKYIYCLLINLINGILLIQLTGYEGNLLSLLNPLQMVKLRELIEVPNFISLVGTPFHALSIMVVWNVVLILVVSTAILRRGSNGAYV